MEENVIAGFLMLNLWGQIEEVVVCPTRPGFALLQRKRTHEVLQIAASYMVLQAAQENTTGMPDNRHISDSSAMHLTEVQSQGGLILPEIASKTTDELLAGFAGLNIRVTTDEAEVLALTIKMALVELGMGIDFALVGESDHSRRQTILFTAPRDWKFRAWKDPGPDTIVPGDHPAAHGITPALMVNGDTDALLSGQAVRQLCAPQGSATVIPGAATWNMVSYPFYGEGSKIALVVSAEALVSLEGMQELQQVLGALLGINNAFVAIVGGFASPYTTADNVARAAGIVTSTPDGRVRGSESWCVWAHETLAREGRLGDAYIPHWFHAEGWLEAYRQYGL